jgi:hypothetical protein
MRHYLNMNADSGTPVVQDSLNNSSITDVAAGQYTVNFTNAFAAANYSTAAGLSGDPSVYCGPIQVHTAIIGSVAVSYSASSFSLTTPNSGFSIIDFAYVGTQTAGTLA